MEKMVISGAPHIRGARTTKKVMIDVCIALAPAFVASVVFFGLNAILITLVSVAAALATELVYKLAMKVPFRRILEEFDYTSLVTGLLIAFNMPSNIPLYVPLLASVFAIAVAKMLFGGTGKNLFNPAISGRIFAFISFSVMASAFGNPIDYSAGGSFLVTDPFTGATPLQGMLQENGVIPQDLLAMFLGNTTGCIGETSALALLIGGAYLVIRKVIDFKLPLIYIGVTGLFTVALNGFDFAYFLPSILGGGLMLGAIFMATDFVTTPNTPLGNIIYFVMLGLLTAGLRQATGTEVVSFVILMMNITVPLFDKYIVPKPFGFSKEKKQTQVKEEK